MQLKVTRKVIERIEAEFKKISDDVFFGFIDFGVAVALQRASFYPL